MRGLGAGDQHGANNQVGVAQFASDGVLVGIQRSDVRAERHHLRHPVLALLEHHHVRTAGCGQCGRVATGGAGAEHHDLAALGGRQAAEQLALAAHRLVQVVRTDLHGDATGDDRHRRQQRQVAAVELDSLEGDAGQADVEQLARQHRLRGEVQVTEQQVVLAQVLQVAFDRLLHLHDQLGLLVEGRRVGRDLDAERGVLVVAEAALDARVLFDPHLMATTHEVGAGGGHEGHAAFEGLGFAGDTDTHGAGLQGAALGARVERMKPP